MNLSFLTSHLNYLYFIIPLLIILLLFIRIKIRGFFWRDKAGNELTFKQFLGRWKNGVEGITPLQQTKTSLIGTYLVIAGSLYGIVLNIFLHLWWLVIIITGGLVVVIVGLIGLLQKYWRFKTIDKAMKEMDKQILFSTEGEEKVGMSSMAIETEDYIPKARIKIGGLR